MTGTIINFIAIIIGGILGTLLGGRLPERVRATVVAAIGLFIIGLSIQMFLQTKNAIIVLGSLLVGALLGEWWRIEDRFRDLGLWLEKRFNRRGISKPQGDTPTAQVQASGSDEQSLSSQERFLRGFLAASLLYCVGPVAILGSIQDGISHNYLLLAVKSVLDGFTAVMFASTFGIGVIFAALPVLVYQGTITLLAAQIQAVTTDVMMAEMTATGGLVLLAVGISSILELKKLRAANMLPAILVAPVVVAVLTLLKIKF